jgi:hypothetical protein
VRDWYVLESEKARMTLSMQTVSYGTVPREALDFFLAPTRDAATRVRPRR